MMLSFLLLFAEGATAARGSARFFIVGVRSDADTDAPSQIDIEMTPMMSAIRRRRDPMGSVMVVQLGTLRVMQCC